MKYSQPHKEIHEGELLEEEEEVEEKPILNGQYYGHPLRGKKSDPMFFPLPNQYLNRFSSTKQARSSGVSMEKVQEVVLPWEMKYFSPMLRG